MRTLARSSAFVLFAAMLFSSPYSATAQSRLSDKDVEHLMQNLRDDAKGFENPFRNALNKSAIRKTSQEKDARELSKRLTRQADGMLQGFKHNKKGEGALQAVTATVQQIDPIVENLGVASEAGQRWDRVHADLRALSPAFERSSY